MRFGELRPLIAFAALSQRILSVFGHDLLTSMAGSLEKTPTFVSTICEPDTRKQTCVCAASHIGTDICRFLRRLVGIDGELHGEHADICRFEIE